MPAAVPLPPPQRGGSLPRPLWTVLVALLLFVLLEAAVQWRSYLKTGASIFAAVAGESVYQRDAALGFNLLRPGHTSGGAQQRIAANSSGLRSPEIPQIKPPGTVRIAVLGASTVMGAYAPTNEATFPALLEQTLRQRQPQRPLDVINAGIAGLGLYEQARLFEVRVAPFAPDLTIVYTGFNDFAGYCRKPSTGATWRARPLLAFGLPPWLLSVELLLKNSLPLRQTPEGLARGLQVDTLDLGPFRQQVASLLQTLQASGTRPLIARNARSYRPEQPLAEQQRLSTTARFYNACFDLAGLHALYQRHNDTISEVAAGLGVPVLPLDTVLPGGSDYFADATHFSARGERLAADWLADRVEPLLPLPATAGGVK